MLRLEDLTAIAEQHRGALEAAVREFDLGSRSFPFNSQPALMGVINLSADSWYRESVCLTTEMAVQRGRVLAAQGAALVDIGAESSLAHAARADAAAQSGKLLPVIRALRAEQILVSVETYQPEVARACLEAGANVVNLTGTTGNKDFYRMVADHEAAVILCYVQGANVHEVGDFQLDEDPIPMMQTYFLREIEHATRSGVTRIFIDPGLGFYYRNLQDSAVRVRHQLTTFLNSFRLRTMGWPICNALPHAFEYFGEEVRAAEPFFAVMAALGKTDLFRTHEVSRTKAVLATMGVYGPSPR